MWQDIWIGGITNSWSAWQPLGGGFHGGPAVTNTSAGRLIYGIGLDAGLWCNGMDGRGWRLQGFTGFHPDPSLPTSGVDIVSFANVVADGSIAVTTVIPDPPPVVCT